MNPTSTAPSIDNLCLDSLDLSPSSSLASSRSNSSVHRKSDNNILPFMTGGINHVDDEDAHFLEQSMMQQMELRDRHLVRRASTRLDTHAIHSLQSLDRTSNIHKSRTSSFKSSSLYNEKNKRVKKLNEKQNKTNNIKQDNSGDIIDIEGTIDSKDSKHHETFLMRTNTYAKGGSFSPTRASTMMRSVSMMVQGDISIAESGNPERCLRIFYNILIFFLAFWGLFMKDLNVLFLPPNADLYILIVSWFVFGLFTIEVIVFAIFLPNYYRSEDMWMEALAAISLLPLGSHLILFSHVDKPSSSASSSHSMYSGTELIYELNVAETIFMILQPIRAAAMANRTALSGSKLLQYSRELVGGVVAEVQAAASPSKPSLKMNHHDQVK
jgi:hypothetical protein